MVLPLPLKRHLCWERILQKYSCKNTLLWSLAVVLENVLLLWPSSHQKFFLQHGLSGNLSNYTPHRQKIVPFGARELILVKILQTLSAEHIFPSSPVRTFYP